MPSPGPAAARKQLKTVDTRKRPGQALLPCRTSLVSKITSVEYARHDIAQRGNQFALCSQVAMIALQQLSFFVCVKRRLTFDSWQLTLARFDLRARHP
jgi:hypothetical protein